jgi:hypothetical protein
LVFGFAQTGLAQTQLQFFNNYFVTGDYVVGGVGLRGLGVQGYATGDIIIPDLSVPPGADIVAALLYWQTVESSQTTFAGQQGFFRGYPITGSVLGNPNAPVSWSSGGCSGASNGSKTMRTYRADVRPYLKVDPNGNVQPNILYQVRLADSGSNGGGTPLTLGATLVIIFRVLDKSFPLNAITLYDGAFAPSNSGSTMSQDIQGFYQPGSGLPDSGLPTPGPISAKLTHIVGNGQPNKFQQVRFKGIPLTPANTAAFPGPWDNPTWVVSDHVLAEDTFETTSVVPSGSNGGCVSWGATIFSTTVQDRDGDGLLDVWEAKPNPQTNPGYCSASVNQGVCTPGDASWVSLPEADPDKKDLFVQLDYMFICNSIKPDGTCKSSGASLLPSPQARLMVSNAFARCCGQMPTQNITLHYDIKNVVPAQACIDKPTATPPEYCSFPDQPGVVGWKGGFEFLKSQPLNYPDELSCQQAPLNRPCERRFQPGRKDSYHYALFAVATGRPNWSFQDGTLISIESSGSGNSSATFTTSREHGLHVGDRVTVSDAITNPNFPGVYFVQNVDVDPTKNIFRFTIPVVNPTGAPYAYKQTTDPGLSVASSQVSSISGLSDIGGADSLITLGLWGPDGQTTQVQAGTFMHELGHSLALTHGGSFFDTPGSYVATVEPNCKPNYQSVMNYMFQVDLLGPAGVLDFSSQQLDTLDENSLGPVTTITTNGAPLPPIAFTTTKWYDVDPPNGIGSPATRHCDGTPFPASGPLLPMFRYEGPTPPPPISSPTIPIPWSSGSLDVNFDGKKSGLPALRGYDDWSNIDLRQIGATGSDLAGSGLLTRGGGLLTRGGGLLTRGGGLLTRGGGIGNEEISFQTANSVVRPPRNLTATVTRPPRKIQLNWTVPSFGQIKSYRVYRAVDGVPVAPPYAPSLSGTSFLDTNVRCGPVYTYFVTALLSDGAIVRESVPSGSVSLRACAQP